MSARHPTRWVKVAWLAGLASGRTTLTTQAAHAALEAVDEEDTPRLVAALRSLELHAATWPVRDLAAGARACVERAAEEYAEITARLIRGENGRVTDLYAHHEHIVFDE